METRRPRLRHLHSELARWAADSRKVKGALGGDIDGMLAEYIVLKETGLVRFPRTSASKKPPRFLAPLSRRGTRLPPANLQPNSTVLIQGTGGVSIFALQFAKLKGLRVIGISSSEAKLQRACSLGLDKGLDYGETSGVGSLGH